MGRPTLSELAGLLTALGLSGVVVELLRRWFARRDKAAAAPGVIAQAEAAAAEAEAEVKLADAEARRRLLEDYVDQLAFVRRQCTRMERSQRRLRGEVGRLKAEVAECEAHRHACDRTMRELREEFDAYVAAHPPAPY